MPNPLEYHSQCEISGKLLRDLRLGSHPDSGADWPTFCFIEPNEPDNCITIYNTTGTLASRNAHNGEHQEFYGVNIKVRSASTTEGARKANKMAHSLDTMTTPYNLTLEGHQYVIYNMQKASSVAHLGKDLGNGNRFIWTLNYRLTVKLIS